MVVWVLPQEQADRQPLLLNKEGKFVSPALGGSTLFISDVTLLGLFAPPEHPLARLQKGIIRT